MTIEAKRAAAARGWAWLMSGWRLFLKAPLPWAMLTMLYLGVGLALSLLPLVGLLAQLALTPLLMGVMIYAAAALDQYGRLDIGEVFRGIQQQERLERLLLLGGLLTGALLLIGVAIMVFAGGAILSGGRIDESRVFDWAFGLGLLLMAALLLLALALLMALFYAVPLVLLDGAAVGESLWDSLVVSTVNVLPLSLFGLGYSLFALLLLPPTLGLGALALWPVTFGGIYASYREVFPGAGRLADVVQVSR